MPKAGWKYHNPVEIFFGAGRIAQLPSLVADRKAALITTPGFTRRGVVDSIRKALGGSPVDVFDGVKGYPTFAGVEEACGNIEESGCEVIIAMGGGSAIDTAKAAVAVAGADGCGWLRDHLRTGADFPEPFAPRPIIAIPTTAGTGSEVTMWATVWDFQEKKKYSLSHPSLYPAIAVLDPELTLTLPEKETIYGGLDALSHAMEAVWNNNHNPVSDTFALKAIELVVGRLPLLKNEPGNLGLRTALLRASLFAGLAFSNTRTALAHSISYPLTAHFGLPHGLACALPLPLLIEFNWARSLDRVKMMAPPLKAEPTIKSMQERMYCFLAEMGLSAKLADYGVAEDKSDLIADSAYTPERADNNIRPVEQGDLKKLVKKLF